jgi:hypothetical protein
MSARRANQAVLPTAVQKSGSFTTWTKLSQPTQVGGETRLVCWKLITTLRTMGHQEKTPKMTSIGVRKRRVLRPPPRTQVRGLLRRTELGLSIAVMGGFLCRGGGGGGGVWVPPAAW